MKFRAFLLSSLAAVFLAPMVHADPIYISDSLTTSSHTELGRASRSGTAQTWASPHESYTGQVNASTTYYYNTYTFNASNFVGGPYLEISVYDENNSADFFVSAFANSYDPTNRGLNWLGDQGSSGNIQFYPGDPGDARTFQVILPTNGSLTLLVNSTIAGTSALNQPFDIAINNYSDTNYDDPTPVAATPEPSSLVMAATGLLGTVGALRRRIFNRA